MSPNTESEPEVVDYYPPDEPEIVIVGGRPRKVSRSRKKLASPKKWLPTRASSRAGRASVEVCYWPDLATFREDSQRKEMCYFTEPMNGYFVHVIFEKKTGAWQTKKFKGDKLVRSAFGSTFDKTMINTTMDGPEPDER